MVDESKSKSKVVTGGIKTAASLASGHHILSRTAQSLGSIAASFTRVKDVVDSVHIDDPENVISNIKDGKIDGQKSRYAVYSHKKNVIFHGDDFEACLNNAYDQEDIAVMIDGMSTARRIQSYGALFISISAIAISILMRSFIPMFSIFPAIMLVSFALRRACFEKSLAEKRPIALMDFLNDPGLIAVWRKNVAPLKANQ